jgi:hypothetical protein
LRRSIDNRELLMPRYFFDLKNGHRILDPSGLDCLDDADAISKGETMARQIEVDGSVDIDSQRHLAVINEEGQQIGKIAVRGVPGGLAAKVFV